MKPVRLTASQWMRENPACLFDVVMGAQGAIVLLTGQSWVDLMNQRWYEGLFEGKRVWIRASILTAWGHTGLFVEV